MAAGSSTTQAGSRMVLDRQHGGSGAGSRVPAMAVASSGRVAAGGSRVDSILMGGDKQKCQAG